VAAVLISFVVGGVVLDYLVAGYRAEQAVQTSVGQSEQALCGIIDLVTAVPEQPPADPEANPSRVTSYRFYLAFVSVGRKYHCTGS